MKIAIATDHRGKELKYEIIKELSEQFEFLDCSPVNYEADDYPDFAFEACKKVKEKKADFGVLICGTGIGMSIAANKVKSIRCALINDEKEAVLAKEHNGANVLAFSSKKSPNFVVNSILNYSKATLKGDNHERRRNKIIKYETGEYNEL